MRGSVAVSLRVENGRIFAAQSEIGAPINKRRKECFKPMPKGYSKEIMEALFREEEQKKYEQAVKDAEKRERQKKQMAAFKEEVAVMQASKYQEKIDKLEKQVKLLRILVIVALIIAVIAVGMTLNTSLKELMLLLP